MAMLSGNAIAEAVNKGDIEITGFDPTKVNPNSYNLHLGSQLSVYTQRVIDPKSRNPYEIITIPDDGYVLEQGVLYLGYTTETTGSKKYVPCLSGVSSIGRLGLQIHQTAGFGDIGWSGTWTLEIVASHPIRVYSNMRIAQIYFYEVIGDGPAYNGKYQGQQGIVPSREYLEYVNK